MTLIAHIYETPDGDTLLKTLTKGFSFSTGRHGFRAWQATLDVGHDEAATIYNWPGVPHVEVVDEADSVQWEGRLEDIAIQGRRVSLGAFGYWRSLLDIPYTALWSKTGSGNWRAGSQQDISGWTPEKYNIDNNNRLYVTLKKNQVYVNSGQRGALVFFAPHNGERNLSRFNFDYDITLPSGWRLRVITYNASFGSASTDFEVIANGSQQTGSETRTITASQILSVEIINLTGSAYTNTAEDEDWYAKLTNLRMTTQATPVNADDIAGALVTYVNGVNSDQLLASTGLIEATTTDLEDELYEDALPGDILDRLAFLHRFETGVYEGRRLYFRERGSEGREWFVNVKGVLDAQRSLDRVANSVYGVYRDAGGRTLRTSAADDDASQGRFGIVRRDYVGTQTASQTEAEAHRDAMLIDRADDIPRIKIEANHLEDEAGGRWPLYHIRAGDTVTFRDLLPYALSVDDRMSTFEVGETGYSVDEPDRISIVSREPLPTLAVVVSSAAAASGSSVPDPAARRRPVKHI